MTVVITDEQDKIQIPADWEEKINRVAAICLAEEQMPEDVEVDLLFVDNEAIREMNREYRDKGIFQPREQGKVRALYRKGYRAC